MLRFHLLPNGNKMGFLTESTYDSPYHIIIMLWFWQIKDEVCNWYFPIIYLGFTMTATILVILSAKFLCLCKLCTFLLMLHVIAKLVHEWKSQIFHFSINFHDDLHMLEHDFQRKTLGLQLLMTHNVLCIIQNHFWDHNAHESHPQLPDGTSMQKHYPSHLFLHFI